MYSSHLTDSLRYELPSLLLTGHGCAHQQYLTHVYKQVLTALLSDVQYVGKYLGFASTKAHPWVLPLAALGCGSHFHVSGFTFIPICRFLQASQLLKSTWLNLWDLVLFRSLFVPSLRMPRLVVSVHASCCWGWAPCVCFAVHPVLCNLEIILWEAASYKLFPSPGDWENEFKTQLDHRN